MYKNLLKQMRTAAGTKNPAKSLIEESLVSTYKRWTPEEDKLLIALRSVGNMSWKETAEAIKSSLSHTMQEQISVSAHPERTLTAAAEEGLEAQIRSKDPCVQIQASQARQGRAVDQKATTKGYAGCWSSLAHSISGSYTRSSQTRTTGQCTCRCTGYARSRCFLAACGAAMSTALCSD
ncbi:hypothetical protein DL89DRAFT_141288 [Linderina pennispora]|uniref:Myb-like domain-containing protein n=1 Tax=Linderina pennispora TaxID=61395 RepID=A0A1Y1WBC8_9FUNG|nr:uncharacterized protein DL89DRAFT_141288 [Linderina pennispora]ORX70841.1 hypothetical protein DL89DRAFT_141288 [Linderina pennispora]